MEALEPPVFNTFGLPHHVVFSWLVMVGLVGVGLAAAHRPALVPRGLQNAMEAVLEFVLTLLDDVIGPEGRRFLPLIATLGLYIFASNLLGLPPRVTPPPPNPQNHPPPRPRPPPARSSCSSRTTGSASGSTDSGHPSATSVGRCRRWPR